MGVQVRPSQRIGMQWGEFFPDCCMEFKKVQHKQLHICKKHCANGLESNVTPTIVLEVTGQIELGS